MSTEPVYIHETINAILWKNADAGGLTVPPLTPPENAEILVEGGLVLRYAIEILETPRAIVPGMFMSERGAIKVGRDAWDWLWAKFMLYPRAEIIGLRDDGKDEHLYVRNLDFGAPVRVLVYADLDATLPLASIQRVDAPEGMELPKLLGQYLAR